MVQLLWADAASLPRCAAPWLLACSAPPACSTAPRLLACGVPPACSAAPWLLACGTPPACSAAPWLLACGAPPSCSAAPWLAWFVWALTTHSSDPDPLMLIVLRRHTNSSKGVCMLRLAPAARACHLCGCGWGYAHPPHPTVACIRARPAPRCARSRPMHYPWVQTNSSKGRGMLRLAPAARARHVCGWGKGEMRTYPTPRLRAHAPVQPPRCVRQTLMHNSGCTPNPPRG
jgi:hypothetical protein